MSSDLQHTLPKLAIPLFTIVMILVASKVRRIRWVEDLGLRWPPPRPFATWLAVWLAWMVVTELVSRRFGFALASPWRAYAPAIVLLRIAAIGLLGPASEELFARGILFYRLRTTPLGAVGAVAVTAAAWALMHYHYDAATIALIFLDGLILGTVRWRTGSVLLPFVMHSLGNLYSIYQSLSMGVRP